MKLLHIIDEIGKIDPDAYDRLDSRRDAMKSFAGMGKKIALSAVPFAFGAMVNKAYGQSSSKPSVIDVLNYALTLEYLESTFYAMGNAKGSKLIPNASDIKAFKIIGKHEMEHVDFLKSAISAAGGKPVDKPGFDFTAGGAFGDVFTNYATFLAVSQTFEDTGVRAYKGQATNIMSNDAYLTAALNIHSVEARHAAHVRGIRRKMGADVKAWITLDQTGGIGSAVQASYTGEDNTTQAGVSIVNINGKGISKEAASEAFDEPLTMADVLKIVKPFLK